MLVEYAQPVKNIRDKHVYLSFCTGSNAFGWPGMLAITLCIKQESMFS